MYRSCNSMQVYEGIVILLSTLTYIMDIKINYIFLNFVKGEKKIEMYCTILARCCMRINFS